MIVYDPFSQRYNSAGQDTIVIAGAEYGSGSSRDWAAKGPMLQVELHLQYYLLLFSVAFIFRSWSLDLFFAWVSIPGCQSCDC